MRNKKAKQTMGVAQSTAGNSTDKIELRTDLPKSSNPFVQSLYSQFLKTQADGTALPADIVAAITKLSTVSEEHWQRDGKHLIDTSFHTGRNLIHKEGVGQLV
jgi:hypothetical protein